MYLSYNSYQEMGGTLDETTFNEFAFEAESVIDWYTFGRLQEDEDVSEKVQRCVFALIKMAQQKQNVTSGDGENAGIASQSNDGVSVSYNILSASEVFQKYPEESKRLVNMYLQGVRNNSGRLVLYRGVYPNE